MSETRHDAVLADAVAEKTAGYADYLDVVQADYEAAGWRTIRRPHSLLCFHPRPKPQTAEMFVSRKRGIWRLLWEFVAMQFAAEWAAPDAEMEDEAQMNGGK